MKAMLSNSLRDYLRGKMKYHLANVRVYLESPVGIGEHPDILGSIEDELGKAAEYEEKLIQLEKVLSEHG